MSFRGQFAADEEFLFAESLAVPSLGATGLHRNHAQSGVVLGMGVLYLDGIRCKIAQNSGISGT
jgi:hypothetical protein